MREIVVGAGRLEASVIEDQVVSTVDLLAVLL